MRTLATSLVLALLIDPAPSSQAGQAETLKALKDEGQVIYSRECASCHGADGTGDGAGPALAGNTALANRVKVVTIVLQGSVDKGMEPFSKVLSDRDVAAVATFVRTAWENEHGVVLEAEVKTIRDQKKTPGAAPPQP